MRLHDPIIRMVNVYIFISKRYCSYMIFIKRNITKILLTFSITSCIVLFTHLFIVVVTFSLAFSDISSHDKKFIFDLLFPTVYICALIGSGVITEWIIRDVKKTIILSSVYGLILFLLLIFYVLFLTYEYGTKTNFQTNLLLKIFLL